MIAPTEASPRRSGIEKNARSRSRIWNGLSNLAEPTQSSSNGSAACTLMSGRFDDASQQCEIALAAERNSADIWALRGDCLFQKQQLNKALAAYHRALALQPQYQSVQIQAAEIYRAQGRYDRLLATLDRIEAGGDQLSVPPRVDLLRGIAMIKLKQWDDAKSHLMIAARKDPLNAEPLVKLAEVSLAQNDPESARVAFERAAQFDPVLASQTRWEEMFHGNRITATTVSAKITDR